MRLNSHAWPKLIFGSSFQCVLPSRFNFVVLIAVVIGCGLLQSNAFADDSAAAAEVIEFGEDVQPILRRHCFRCHGGKTQEASLQLNARSSAMGEADSAEPIIVPGDSDASLLIKRIVSDEHGDVMPIDGKPLSASEIKTLRRWIDAGAEWPDQYADSKHWAYQPVSRPDVPEIDGSKRHAIDAFVLARMKRRGLSPSARLDRARLLRRVSLAVIGLPPTPEEVDAFLADDSDDAYEKVVDRLLRSPRFGERWAVPWLDLARYADSNGFQADQFRDNWAYRDWVIDALNQNMPFDQFVIDQIAGDLHPNATSAQRVATGFHRMTTCNVEAGVHPEANRTDQIVDRVNTTATAFLGTTMECAQCHDHKYDPFTQEDYYQLFAYFNNTPLEVKNTSGVTWDFYGPKMDLPQPEAITMRLEKLEQEIDALKKQRGELSSASDEEFAGWLEMVKQSVEKEIDWRSVVPESFATSGGETYEILDDGTVLLTGSVPDTVEHTFTLQVESEVLTAIRIDALTDDRIPGKGPGRGDAKRTNIILSEVTAQLVRGKETTELELTNADADFSQTGWPVANAIDGNRKTGWAIAPKFGQPHWAQFQLAEKLALQPGDQVKVTLGQFYGRGRVIGKPRVSVFAGDPQLLLATDEVKKLAAKKKPSKKDKQRLREVFDKANPSLRKLDQNIAGLEKEIAKTRPDTTLVMMEMEKPRDTFVLIRGDYENHGKQVEAGTPASLPQLESGNATGDRMELARWIVSRNNPLTARVTVNRWWAEIFGEGLVSTPEDFGTQAESPSHPLLLDWLAMELIDSGWSMKHVIKLMVMSETFAQSSTAPREQWRKDPSNRYLARGPRFRLSAEAIRDNALAVSGLLSTKMHGRPIMPHQPDNLWRSVGRNQPKWVVAQDENRFRRGVYVVFKRAAPYPSFINFDAPDRGSCTVQRGRSNTPMQALTLLNDPAYVEIALATADRILTQADDKTDEGRVRYGLKLALSRPATSFEVSVFTDLLRDERERIASNPKLVAERTKLQYKGVALNAKDRAELAAWFAVANTLLNLDETMTQ